MSAMIYGGIARERVQFNVDSLWSGKYESALNKANTFKSIESIRELVLKDQYDEVERLAGRRSFAG